FFFFSSRRRYTRSDRDWSSDVCSSDLVVEDAGHVRGALNVRMAAESIYATAGAAHVAEQQLQHRGRTNDLRAKRVLRPADGVNNRARLLHVAVFANRCKEVGGFEELFPGNAGDALDHLRGIPRV